MNVLEKDIEDLIWDCIQDGKTHILRDRGLHQFDDKSLYFRQVNLGSYGIADIIKVNYDRVYDKTLTVTIVELKKGNIDFSAVGQAFRYMTGVQRFLETEYGDSINNLTIRTNIIIIGTSVEKTDFCYALGKTKGLSAYTVQIDLESGVKFNLEHGYSLKNENFNSVDVKNIDKTKKYIREIIFEDVNNLSQVELPF